MKRLYFIIFTLIVVQQVVVAQYNVCQTGSYTYGVDYAYPVNDQVYWASRRDATGTIVTTDGGNTWTLSSFVDPKAFPVYCIHAFNADVAFVTASTIYKTTDRGTTWTPATGIFTNTSSFPNTIHFFDQNNGVAMGDPVDGYFEIYTTTNAGTSWVRVPQGNIPAPLAGEIGLVNDHNYSGNSYWFPTNSQRLFRSTDRGYTWTYSQIQAASGVFPSVAFRDELNGLAITVIGNSLVLCKTNDGGSTWTYYNVPNWIYGAANIAYVHDTQSTYTINSISFSGIETKNMILFTKDDGLTWNRIDDWGQWLNGDGIGYHQWTGVNSGWGSIYRGNEGCIYHWPGYTGKHIWRAGSTLKYGTTVSGEIGDTASVNVGNFGTLPTTINSFTFPSANFILVNPPTTPLVLQPWECIELKISFTPQTRGIFNDSIVIHSDAANYSSLSVNLSGKALAFTPPLPDLIYAASDSLYNLNLSNLTAVSVGWFEGLQIGGMALEPINSILVGISVGTSSSVLYKIDPVLGGCAPFATIPLGNIKAIAFTPSGTLFAAQKSGSLYKINTTTGEPTLIGTASGVPYSSIVFSPVDGKLYASVSKIVGADKDAIYIVDTTSAAATKLGNTGDGESTPSIAFDTLGTLYGLKGTGSAQNKLITINTTDGTGSEICTLNKSGLLTFFVISEITLDVRDEKNGAQVISYELSQNYPNPFNPITVIRYQLPLGGNVTLKIYDLIGNEVATLVDEFKPAGRYEVEFNTVSHSGNVRNLTSGVYFYQLKAVDPESSSGQGFVETKKMLLLK